MSCFISLEQGSTHLSDNRAPGDAGGRPRFRLGGALDAEAAVLGF